MSSNVHNGATFSAATDFKYTKPKANKSGGKSVGIQSATDNKSLHLSTPLMMTWGVSGYENPQTGNVESYDLSLQFPREQDANYNEDTTTFLQSMKEYEARIKADAVKNSKDWFGKALPYYDDTFKVEIYDLDRNMIFPNPDRPELTPVELVQKTQNVALVIQSGGIWFANGKFGTTWRLVQAVVQPKASILGNRTCHVVLNNSAKATLRADRDAEEVDAGVSGADDTVASTTVESSDEEDAQEEAVPEPAPTPKKKVVRKKKVAA
jgi:hypothetical protein